MDGLVDLSMTPRLSALATRLQRTLAAAIDCVGVGLHSGRRIHLVLRPAPVATGIVFRRADLGVDVPARFDRVVDTRMCTVIGASGVSVGTVEHVMAALAGAGIDNAIVEVDGPEVPVLDGSAAPFVFLIDCAGVVDQDAPVLTIEVARAVRVEEGDAFAELRPGRSDGLDMSLSIDFAAPAIGRQTLSLSLDDGAFRHELARARTFAQAHEIEGLRAAGLARGGSLDNAVVVDGSAVLNPGGLRMADEFVRHKMLDAVGDLALAGALIAGRFIGHKSGHGLNNRLLRALFAERSNWRPATAPVMSGWTALPMQAAAFRM